MKAGQPTSQADWNRGSHPDRKAYRCEHALVSFCTIGSNSKFSCFRKECPLRAALFWQEDWFLPLFPLGDGSGQPETYGNYGTTNCGL